MLHLLCYTFAILPALYIVVMLQVASLMVYLVLGVQNASQPCNFLLVFILQHHSFP